MSIAKLLDKAYDNILRFNGYEIILLFDKDNNIWVSYPLTDQDFKKSFSSVMRIAVKT